MRRLFVALAVAAFAASAAAAEKYDLEKVRADNAQLIREWCRAGWDNSVYGKAVDIAGLLEKYSYLSDDPQLLAFIKEKRAEAPDLKEQRRLHYLYRDLATTYESKRVASLEDEMENRSASDYLYVRGFEAPIPLREFYAAMRQADDEDPYMNLYYALSNYSVTVMNPLRLKRLRVHHESTSAAGYESYADFYYQLLGYDAGVPAAQARNFRDETFPAYKELVTARCRQLYGKDPAETPPWESKNIHWGKDFDRYFPKETFLKFTYGFFAGLGTDVRGLADVTVDDADRPAKEPRATCWAFDAPSDVRVNLKPVGGADDYETAFHEFGHALHGAYADPDLPYEFRMLGSNELTETYAFFFQDIFGDRAFLVGELAMPEDVVDDFLRFKLMTDMRSARSAAFNVIYDEALHSGELEDPLAFYDAELDKQRLFPKYPVRVEATYLNVDEGFYALYYTAAYYAAAQLRAKVVEKFGSRWYKDPAAGEFLKALFRQGDSITVTEMLQQIGYAEGLNPAYLIAEYQARYDALNE
jgi:hypothetical protein